MASTYPNHGANGAVVVGAATLARMTLWKINQSCSVTDVKYARATAVEKLSDGMVNSTINIEAILVNDDTAQAALVVGTEVTLKLYADGAIAGNDEWSCSAIIESRDIDNSITDVTKISIVAAVNGAITPGVMAS